MDDSIVKKLFVNLSQNENEGIHYDFKKIYDISKQSKNRIKARDSFIKDVLSMYNAVEQNDRYTSSSGAQNSSSYILLGILDKKTGVSKYCPDIQPDIDPTEFQQIVKDRIIPKITILHHPIRFSFGEIEGIPAGTYGLIEIRKGKEGPAFPVPKKKLEKGETSFQSSDIYSRQQGTNYSPKDVVDQHLRKKIYDSFHQIYMSITPFKDSIKQHRNKYLRILLFNDIEESYLQEEKSKEVALQLMQALGYEAWDVIVDLCDYKEPDDPILESFNTAAGHERALKRFSYLEDKPITPGDVFEVQQCKKTLHIFTNGFLVREDQGNRRKTLPRITSQIIESIIGNMENPKPLLLVVCILGPSSIHEIPLCIDAVADANEECRRKGKTGKITLKTITVCLRSEYQTPLAQCETEEVCNNCFVCPIDQLCNTFVELTKHNQKKDPLIFFPGKGDSKGAQMKMVEYKPMEGMITLLHSKVGVSSENEQKINEVAVGYLRGEPLSFEALYLNEKVSPPFIVLRHIEKEKELLPMGHALESDLRSYLSRVEERVPTDPLTYTITHDPSSGGTTFGRFMLWSFRYDYPCIVVNATKQPEFTMDYLYSCLRRIFKVAQKPLLVLIDSADYQADFLRSIFHSVHVPMCILHVVRMSGSTTNKPGNIHVPSQIQHRFDRTKFREVFGYYSKQTKGQADRVFLFPLLAFNKDFSKINQLIQFCTKGSFERVKVVIRFICMYWKYTKRHVNKSMISCLLELDVTEPWDEVKDALGLGMQLLVIDDEFLGLRPAHDSIIEHTMECTFGGLSSNDPKYSSKVENISRLRQFVFDDLFNLMKQHGKLTALDKFLFSLYIDKFGDSDRQEELDTQQKPRFAPFICDYEAHMGTQETSHMLKELCCIMSSIDNINHIRAMYARYLMFQCNETDLAISEIRNVLKIPDGRDVRASQETDSVLLTIYGNLLKAKINRIYNASYDGDENGVKKEMLEGILVFNRAKIGGKNIHPYIGEAQLRYIALKYLLNIKFNQDLKKYFTYLEALSEKDVFYLCALKALSVLERLNSMLETTHFEKVDITESMKLSCQLQLDLCRIYKDPSYKQHPPSNGIQMSCVVIQTMGENKKFVPQKWFENWFELTLSKLVHIHTTLSDLLAPFAPDIFKSEARYKEMVFCLLHISRLLNSDMSLRMPRNVTLNLKILESYLTMWGKAKAQYGDNLSMHTTALLKGLIEFQYVRDDRRKDGHALSLGKSYKFIQDCWEKSKHHQRGRNAKRFCIGQETDIYGLIPYNIEMEKGIKVAGKEQNRLYPGLQVFLGNLETSSSQFYIVCDKIPGHKAYIDRHSLLINTHRLRAQEKPTIKFNLAFSPGEVLAMNEEYAS